ncbi:MAG: DUF697 domain-containing protein [Actinobacteria bacterium]|nr:DUF697 domain-containing protein [Actinomycetota bacterium]
MSISKIVKAVREARSDDTEIARLCVVGAGPELGRVTRALSAGAADGSGGISAALDALPPADFPMDEHLAGRWDIVVLVAAGCAAADMAPIVGAVRGAGHQVIALVEPPYGEWIDAAGVFDDEVARGLRGDRAGAPNLENRIVRAAGDDAAMLVAHLPALRRAYCDQVVLANASQNAVIGAVVIIPGADMPAMTANQIRMVLKIAVVYGEEIGLDRALEILSVVGTAFVFRALARQALDFVPGFGWALKGAVGFTATVALGEAAVAYFEAGAPLQISHMQRISQQLERARSRLPRFVQHRLGPR